MKIVCKNKKAFFNYIIQDKYQAGIVLSGDEVKSLRSANSSIEQAYAHIKNGQAILINFFINEYDKAYFKSGKSETTRRNRTLLLHRREIAKIAGQISRKGLTLIPLQAYFNDKGLLKIDLATAKHKNTINKKQEIKERDLKRQTIAELKNKR
jgi:SsrA-binding protein